MLKLYCNKYKPNIYLTYIKYIQTNYCTEVYREFIILILEKPTIKYCIVDHAGLPGPLPIFIHKITYLFDLLKWILLRMLNDHCKYSSL